MSMTTAERQPTRLMPRVLIVDEDVDTAARLQYHLQEQGYWVDIEPAGGHRMRAELFGGYAILIMEVMLSYMDGFDLLRQVRDHSAVPVLVLTAQEEESDRIAGLELGADDYVVKPCSPREVAARVRALLRRSNPSSAQGGPEVLRSGRLTMWPAQRRVEWLGVALRLTRAEYSLLEMLLRNAGRPVSKTDLALRALGQSPGRTSRRIDVHVSRIRRKLGDLSDERPLIQAVHLNGYQLLEE
jgi:two-component system, OmpR family, response regulator